MTAAEVARGDSTGKGVERGTGRGRGGGWRLLPSLARLRLASGLVLFAFVLLHFLNHALGLVSIAVMDVVQTWRWALWRSPPGTILLYGAFAVHIALGVRALFRRRTWRMPVNDALQIGLGFAIPVLLVGHILGTRGMHVAAGVDDFYEPVLRRLWPEAAVSQSLLVVIVWGHASIGLYHWLRPKAWFPAAAPWLLSIATALPLLALAGWIEAARRLELLDHGREVPRWPNGETAALAGWLAEAGNHLVFAFLGAVGLGLIAVRVATRLRAKVRISYGGGRLVRARPGPTLLEISRMNGVPHVSICGGRGRCTTCRVLVTAGGETLPPRGTLEETVLARIDAPPDVRLACQIRPTADLGVHLLVPAEGADAGQRDPYRWGVERRITVLFADLRGFTSLAEGMYPYDTVFLLNSYFEAMTAVIERHGGTVDKFLGDGIMALFGTRPERDAGARAALASAGEMLAALEDLNAEFAGLVPTPLRMGLGIHTGPAVLGRVGGMRRGGERELTALGDTVNTASRLEEMTKEFRCLLVTSEDTLKAAGIECPGGDFRHVVVRGRSETIAVWIADRRETIGDILTVTI